METHTENSPSPSGKVSNFDFDIDSLEFKPINKGLGFHQKDKDKVQKRSTTRALNKTNTNTNRVRSSNNDSNVSRSALSSFYQSESSEKMNRIDARIDVRKEPEVQRENLVIKSLIAWLIDLGIVVFFLAVTGLFLILASGININLINKLLASNEIYIFCGLLFTFYYYLYFTILDVSGSPGKNTMSVKVVELNNEAARMKHLFIRTTVTLLSLPLCGLPLFLDIHGKLSKTKLVKSKK